MVRLATTPGLFLETLRSVNRILAENAAKAPFKDMLRAAERLRGRDLTFMIYRGGPQIEVDHFTVRFDRGEFELIMRGRQSDRIDCELSYGFLEDVVDNQDRYVEDPEALDWSWLWGLLEEPDRL